MYVEIARYQLKGGMVVDNKRVKAELIEIGIPGAGVRNKWILNIGMVDQFAEQVLDVLTPLYDRKVYYQEIKYENFQWHCRAVTNELVTPVDTRQLQQAVFNYLQQNTKPETA